MKCFLFAAILLLAASCAKNPIENQCHQVYNTKEIWQDSAEGYVRTDTTWRSKSVLCGEELHRLSAFPDSWVKVCNPDGSTHYWEHWKVVIGRG